MTWNAWNLKRKEANLSLISGKNSCLLCHFHEGFNIEKIT